MHGIQGSGALLFSPRLKIEPVQFGGTGSESYNLDMPDVYPDALEAGTLNYPAILSLFEGTLYVQSKLTQNAHYVSDLTALAIERLKTVSGVKILFEKERFGYRGVRARERAFGKCSRRCCPTSTASRCGAAALRAAHARIFKDRTGTCARVAFRIQYPQRSVDALFRGARYRA